MFTGVKLIEIHARTAYPVVSAYAFTYLQEEEVVKNHIKDSSLYCIIQRPLMSFQNLTIKDAIVEFEISDGENVPLTCKLNLVDAGFIESGEAFQFEVQFYEDRQKSCQPFNDVAAFKILSDTEEFIVWETPNKILYENVVNGLPLLVEGDLIPYLTYHLHYVGKSWSQDIWDRLNPHTTYKKILTVEPNISAKSRMPSHEISLLLLNVVDFDDVPLIGYWEPLIPIGVEPIPLPMNTEEECEILASPLLELGASELTCEAEALLINLFRPKHNSVLYKNYPNIANGTRSVGYTQAHLTISGLPVFLSTAYHPAPIVGDVELTQTL